MILWNEQFLISYCQQYQGSGMKLTSNLRFLIIFDRSIYLRDGPAASFGKRWMATRCDGCCHPSSLEKEPISLATAMVIMNIETYRNHVNTFIAQKNLTSLVCWLNFKHVFFNESPHLTFMRNLVFVHHQSC